MLPADKVLWGGKRDLSNCFYLFRTNPARLERQTLGLRVPSSWFKDVDNDALDWASDDEHWHARGLGLTPPATGDELDDGFVAVAVAVQGGHDG